MNRNAFFPNFLSIFRRRPHAMASIYGSPDYPEIQGQARFWQTTHGVMCEVELIGLPTTQNPCESPILAMHIHNGESCSGTPADPFSNAGTHYNPNSCPHPYHAGDLPPIFVSAGYGFLSFLTDRFTAEEIIGKIIIIHSSPDDFTTQPAGNSGIKIACGEIY